MTLSEKEQKKRDTYYADPAELPPECDILCKFRSCYSKYEDRGHYQQGTGYAKYFTVFNPACATRLHAGCPEWRGQNNDEVAWTEAIQWAHDVLKTPATKKRTAVLLRYKALRLLERTATHPDWAHFS